MVSKILSFAEFLFESEDTKVYTIPGDPYSYKVINGSWFTKGPKMSSWKSLAGDNQAISILNKAFPGVASNKASGNKTTSLPTASVASASSSSKSSAVSSSGSGTGSVSWSSIKSNQVVDELNYLQKEGLLSKQKFTILDDKNGSVYCFNPGYSFYKAYPVITGAQSGDALTTKTIQSYIKENPGVIIDAVKKGFEQNPNSFKNFFTGMSTSLLNVSPVGGILGLLQMGRSFFADTKNEKGIIQTIIEHLDSSYFNHEFKIKQTPSGIFKRAGNVYNYLNDKFLTGIAEKDYGKRYITWETLDGKTIAYGFHGTGNPARIKRLEMTEKFLKSPARKMSFGCINFSEPNVLDIDKFIGPGQVSIWLPDTTSDIVKFPAQEIAKYKDRSESSEYYAKKGIDQKTQSYYRPNTEKTPQAKMTSKEQDDFDKSFMKDFKNLKKG